MVSIKLSMLTVALAIALASGAAVKRSPFFDFIINEGHNGTVQGNATVTTVTTSTVTLTPTFEPYPTAYQTAYATVPSTGFITSTASRTHPNLPRVTLGRGSPKGGQGKTGGAASEQYAPIQLAAPKRGFYVENTTGIQGAPRIHGKFIATPLPPVLHARAVDNSAGENITMTSNVTTTETTMEGGSIHGTITNVTTSIVVGNVTFTPPNIQITTIEDEVREIMVEVQEIEQFVNAELRAPSPALAVESLTRGIFSSAQPPYPTVIPAAAAPKRIEFSVVKRATGGNSTAVTPAPASVQSTTLDEELREILAEVAEIIPSPAEVENFESEVLAEVAEAFPTLNPSAALEGIEFPLVKRAAGNSTGGNSTPVTPAPATVQSTTLDEELREILAEVAEAEQFVEDIESDVLAEVAEAIPTVIPAAAAPKRIEFSVVKRATGGTNSTNGTTQAAPPSIPIATVEEELRQFLAEVQAVEQIVEAEVNAAVLNLERGSFFPGPPTLNQNSVVKRATGGTNGTTPVVTPAPPPSVQITTLEEELSEFLVEVEEVEQTVVAEVENIERQFAFPGPPTLNPAAAALEGISIENVFTNCVAEGAGPEELAACACVVTGAFHDDDIALVDAGCFEIMTKEYTAAIDAGEEAEVYAGAEQTLAKRDIPPLTTRGDLFCPLSIHPVMTQLIPDCFTEKEVAYLQILQANVDRNREHTNNISKRDIGELEELFSQDEAELEQLVFDMSDEELVALLARLERVGAGDEQMRKLK